MSESQISLRRHIMLVSTMSAVLVMGIGTWAFTTELSSAVIGVGQVVVDGDVKKVQHLTGGVVSELLVHENEHVKAGQVLIRLDGTSVQANLAIVENGLAQLYAQRARLKAEQLGAHSFTVTEDLNEFASPEMAKNLLAGEQRLFDSRQTALEGSKSQLASRKKQLGEQIKGYDEQIASFDEALLLIDEELKGAEATYKKGLSTLQRVNNLKRQKVDIQGSRGARISAKAEANGRGSEIELQILQLDKDYRSEVAKSLTEVEAKIAELEERRTAALDQLNRLNITSPFTGTVHELTVHTVNGVIEPGQTLMMVVPENNDLLIEAKIATKDIDQVYQSQKVDIRFSAFDQRTTPDVPGEVISVAPDTVQDQRTGASYYPLRIRPEPEALKELTQIKLYPGMPAEVFIKIGERTVISYLAKPLTDQMQHVFREE